jgi:hypothetical protein
VLTSEELDDYYRVGDGAAMRGVVAYHVSEWSEKANWGQELASAAAAPDLKEMGIRPADVQALVDSQIAPSLWWSESVAEKLAIPRDGRVYTYQPITFLVWLQRKLTAEKSDEFVRTASADDIRTAQAGTALDDRESDGTHMADDRDLAEIKEEKPLELQDMIKGYGDEEY